MNQIKQLLIDLDICSENSIHPYFPNVRDRNDISVLKCNKSGVLFLSESEHIEAKYYEEKPEFSYWSAESRQEGIFAGYEDLERRVNLIKPIILNKSWADIGTGLGGILDELGQYAKQTYAVEPQRNTRKNLEKLGYKTSDSIKNLQSDEIDVCTLFHVFEHFVNPLEELTELNSKMSEKGKIVIEVPHANDFLISHLDSEPFKKFTFWSEHLILHTRQSLKVFLENAGFSNIQISGYQRYPLANHLHWLAKGKPGGHIEWNNLRTPDLDCAYQNLLNTLDATDTLIATAQKI